MDIETQRPSSRKWEGMVGVYQDLDTQSRQDHLPTHKSHAAVGGPVVMVQVEDEYDTWPGTNGTDSPRSSTATPPGRRTGSGVRTGLGSISISPPLGAYIYDCGHPNFWLTTLGMGFRATTGHKMHAEHSPRPETRDSKVIVRARIMVSAISTSFTARLISLPGIR